jgi:deazaflavin-dependent oxidoreductase (nitroreductase family)
VTTEKGVPTMYTGAKPPHEWTARLREPWSPDGDEIQPHPIETTATDTGVPWAREHARRYIASSGQDDGWDGPRPILLLYTRGRTSGALRRFPLLFFSHDGERFVIASRGGDVRNPDWFLNVVADPHVYVRVDGDFYEADAEILDEAERATLWPLVTERYPVYAGYQQNTGRTIPLIRLARPRPVV